MWSRSLRPSSLLLLWIWPWNWRCCLYSYYSSFKPYWSSHLSWLVDQSVRTWFDLKQDWMQMICSFWRREPKRFISPVGVAAGFPRCRKGHTSQVVVTLVSLTGGEDTSFRRRSEKGRDTLIPPPLPSFCSLSRCSLKADGTWRHTRHVGEISSHVQLSLKEPSKTRTVAADSKKRSFWSQKQINSQDKKYENWTFYAPAPS